MKARMVVPAPERGSAAELSRALAATLLAIAITAAVETARLPSIESSRALQLILGTYALSLAYVARELAASVLLVPLLCLVNALQERGFRLRPEGEPSRRARTAGLALRLLLIGAAVGAAYRKLILYPDFARYPPAWFLFLGLFFGLGLVLGPSPRVIASLRARFLRAAHAFGVPVLALGGAIGCYAIDALAYKGHYPSLHASVLQVGHLLLSIGLWRAAALVPVRVPRRVSRSAWAFAAAACVLAVATAASAVSRRAYPYWSSHTTIGQTQTILRAYSEPRGAGKTGVLSEQRAAALFREHAGLPELPPGFDLLRYNVLLVQSEATRFDQTSLADERLRTTPALRAFHERGAFNFTRAHSPSSGTFQSTAGLFGMSYPSFLNMQVWHKPWQGHYQDEQPLPAELFAAAGYHTFWIGHNKEVCFTQTVLGFDRGFEHRDLLSKKQSRSPRADERIAADASAYLKTVSKQQKRFFGWLFFVAPHSNYKAHYPDWPAKTPLDKYRQEVRFFDEQFGKVLRQLDKLGRLSDTIVVYTADHGEEFLEHGGRWHKSTIYSEVTNVPLLIWLPGVSGKTVQRPTATSYLFPWLFQRGSPAMRQAAWYRLRRDIGPLLERTGGAVVTELLGPDRMLSSLIYPKRKFNYDFNSTLHQAYRIDRDPLEQRNLFEVDQAIASEAEARVAAYRGVRADRRAFVLRPDKKDPRKDHQ
jgi:glucan phosphoethanolaminetransferase (alkaline phosphatase superfamily)